VKNTKQVHKIMANEKPKSSNVSLGLEDISVLLETLEKHEVTEFKLERENEKIWLKRGPHAPSAVQGYLPYPAQVGSYSQGNSPQSANSQNPLMQTDSGPSLTVVPGTSAIVSNKNIKEIRSPMVGTFYRRPAVDAEPYVAVGDTVKKGDVLCIVEAMKLMNEIESEASGKITEVCLEDGQMVEYGEVLFRVEIA
jgi:acetyl-CoA carboxylase biotin carboxyl carrier protein